MWLKGIRIWHSRSRDHTFWGPIGVSSFFVKHFNSASEVLKCYCILELTV